MRDDSCQLPPTRSVFCLSYECGAVPSCPFFDVIKPILLLPAAFPSTFQDTLKDGLGKTVVSGYVAKPCQLPPAMLLGGVLAGRPKM